MPIVAHAVDFDTKDLAVLLGAMPPFGLDDLDFGVIGFDAAGFVRLYNRHESEAAGLSSDRVVGRLLFTEVAPCMNNFMVAQRFEDAAARTMPLDATIDYVLTLRMKPVKVALRLLCVPGHRHAFVLVRRRAT